MISVVDCVLEFETRFSLTRTGRGRLFTNFFLSVDCVRQLVLSRRLFVLTSPAGDVFLCRENGFQRMLFSVRHLDALGEQIRHVGHQVDGVVAADLVGQQVDMSVVRDRFLEHGFVDRRLLRRMVSSGKPNLNLAKDTEVVFADTHDSEWICDSLAAHFDLFSDRLPCLEEVEKAVERRAILAVRKSGQMCGFLHFESLPRSCLIKFLYVDERFRGRNFGSILLGALFSSVDLDTRVRVWVGDENCRAIALYRRFGFEFDSLVDVVVVRGTENG